MRTYKLKPPNRIMGVSDYAGGLLKEDLVQIPEVLKRALRSAPEALLRCYILSFTYGKGRSVITLEDSEIALRRTNENI